MEEEEQEGRGVDRREGEGVRVVVRWKQVGVEFNIFCCIALRIEIMCHTQSN